MSRLLGLVLFLVLAAASQAGAQSASRFSNPAGQATGACTSSALGGTNGACTNRRMLEVIQCGEIGEMASGTYQGAAQMLDTVTTSVSARNCSLGNEVVIRAAVDGGVFIDGQFARYPVWIGGVNYWTFRGFDVGNSNDTVISLGHASLLTSHITMQRIVASNNSISEDHNVHVLAFAELGSTTRDSLFEDMALFGWGRNMIVESAASNNVLRRIWMRHEGYWSALGGAMDIQAGYRSTQNSLYENIIATWDTSLQGAAHPNSADNFPVFLVRNSTPESQPGYTIKGLIGYSANNPAIWMPDTNAFMHSGSNQEECAGPGLCHVKWNLTDIFIDARNTPLRKPFYFEGTESTGDRLTAVVASGSPSNTFNFTATNSSTFCNGLANCPNFYTGTGVGTGSRACFQYEDGTLTSTPLWPWPMDDRIKAALARAHAAGTGGDPLSGSAGDGYAANTVTSEIVARYGSLPDACNRAAGGGEPFVPAFPEADDFPATPVLDTFDRANGAIGSDYTVVTGAGFNVADNLVVATADFQRVLRNVATYTGSYEAYISLPTVIQDGEAAVILMFGNTAIEDAGWRLIVDRASGGNDTVYLGRMPGAVVIWGPVDLGGEITDGASFGVRVEDMAITVFWEHEGTWYEVGSTTDETLPTEDPVYLGFGGRTSNTLNDFGGGAQTIAPPTNLRILD